MSTTANFRVDPRLASLLSENYRSTEQALKELVDNAWDADAENVSITLPSGFSHKAIEVKDDGLGMTDAEVRQEYLSIARNRRHQQGDRTSLRNRLVKGRKGIGKFAGLVAAEVMEIETRSRGKLTQLRIGKQEVLKSSRDLEEIELPLKIVDCAKKEHGTLIRLLDLNQKLAHPDPSILRQLLVLEYGRQKGIIIKVNGEQLVHNDLPGRSVEDNFMLPEGGTVKLQLTLLDSPTSPKFSGIIVRVQGKVVGKPSFFGLEDRLDIPKKLLNRIVGEIEADSLADDVTSDWGAIIENSTAYQQVRDWVHERVAKEVTRTFTHDVRLAKARLQKEINQRLEMLPEHRRHFAEKKLDAVMRKFYGDSDERIDTVVGLVLDALEFDEYWVVCQKIEAARRSDVAAFAEALDSFGLLDMALMAEQATRRMRILDDLDQLASKEETLEKEMHKALEKNLWVFGIEYSLMSSNITLARLIEGYTGKQFVGERANKRPDLLLAQNVLRHHLLVEFKRPGHTLSRDDESQAKKYRDDLTPEFGRIDILLVGGKVNPAISEHYASHDVKFLSYPAVFSNARNQLEWLMKEFGRTDQVKAN